MGFQIGQAISVAAAVTQALNTAANNPVNTLEKKDVPVIAQQVTEKVTTQLQPVVDVLTNNEPWYKSPQALMALISLIATVLGIFGVTLDAEAQKQLLTIITTGVSLVTAVVLFWNRYIRKSALLARLGL